MNWGKVKDTLEYCFNWFPFYKGMVGGHRYYNVYNKKYSPSCFRAYGKNIKICKDVDITTPERMCIGDGVFIGPNCMISAIGGIYLGNYCGIGARSVLFSIEHRHYGAETIPFDDVRLVKPIWIEDYAWIGINVSVLPGVRIGEGAIVGLGSVVTKDVEPLKIVMGNPAQVIGSRDRSTFDKLKNDGMVRAPSLSANKLWIPPLTIRKYSKELAILGFDHNKYESVYVDIARNIE